jgi:NADH dehydrogenase
LIRPIMPQQRHCVTGAFGYSGKYIARRLLDAGHEVVTLTHSPGRPHPFGAAVRAFPFDFDAPDRLTATLRGVEVLYNTYWVRFNHRDFTFAEAVRNTMTLFDCARAAGVRRIVHVSIANPDEKSDLEYFSGKARLERALAESGLSRAILRPTVLFGREDILINNIAWALRRLPVYGLFGDGNYRLQPIHVDDLARLAVEQGAAAENATINAIGPETFTFREMVLMIGKAIGAPRPVIGLPPALAYAATSALGWWVDDRIITREEIKGLMRGLLCVETPPTGSRPLSDWTRDHAATLGARYANEVGRRRARSAPYVEQDESAIA